MIPPLEQLRTRLAQAIDDADEQGHDVGDLRDQLASLRTIGEAADVAGRLAQAPMRPDWPYVEPDDLQAIRAESDPSRATGAIGSPDPSRIRDAFIARVCGCMLGKGFEVFVGLDEIRSALEANGEWPLRDYPTEKALRALPSLQGQWRELARERITHVAVDDDINYTILAMLTLESHGAGFTHDDMRALWLYNLPVLATFGPERTMLIASAIATLEGGGSALHINPGAELCGALIRADAYGYACMGRPELASELAHRDASFTHRRTGVYGAMFVAAAIAIAPFVDDRLEIFREALRFVPQNSRFAERTRAGIEIVENADDWLEAHAKIRDRFGDFGFCRIYQEIGMVINSVRFASDPGDGICIQVMQGLDTDSFAATAGSILGAHLGPIDRRWVRPFNDDVRTALASFHERSLSAIAARMAALPERVS